MSESHTYTLLRMYAIMGFGRIGKINKVFDITNFYWCRLWGKICKLDQKMIPHSYPNFPICSMPQYSNYMGSAG